MKIDLEMIVGDSGNPNSPITLTPAWSTENSEGKFLKKRDQWYHLFFWVSGTSASKQMMFRIGEINQATPSPFYLSTTTIDIAESSATSITVTQNDLTTATKLYIGGFPSIGVFAANTNYGGCGFLKNLVFLPNYQPSDTSDANILQNHMFEIDMAIPGKINAYNFRTKNIPALNLVKECDVPSLVQLNMQSTDNAYSKKGIQFGYGDYYECVNTQMVPTGDVVFTFKFYFSEAPTEDFNIFSMLYKQDKSFFSTGMENGKLPVYFKLIKLGLFLCPDGKLKLYHIGLPYKMSYQYNVNIGYTVAIVAKKIPDTFYAGPLETKRLFIVYVDGVRSETFTFSGNFGAFDDLAKITQRNHYFYMGDYTSRSINKHNYAFVTPNPLNNFGPLSTEREFTSPILFMQDLVIYENSTLTTETSLLPSNCLIGVPGTDECIKCSSGYSLTSKYVCTLKSGLASYIVQSNNYDLTIECGDGLFFNTVLNFCQNCPSGCANCNSITDCVVKTTGCISNCAQCYQNGTCLACSNGYALNSGTNTCTQCIISSGTNPCYSCDAAAPLVCFRCFDQFFLNNGTNGCDACSSLCKTCETTSNVGTKCTSCNSNKYLSGSSCLSLPAGVFLWKQDSITRNCFPTCSACESSEITKCTQCYSDYIPVLTTDTVKGNLNIFSCDSKCPVTHYITSIYQSVAGTYCLPCETLVTNCIKCQQDSPTSKAICQKCISGFYVNVDVNTLFNNICTKCDAACAECAGTPTNCIACASGKVLSYDSGASTYSCVTDPATLAATNRICPHEKYLYKGQCYEKDCPDGSFRRRYYTDDCASCEVATPGCFSCNKATGVCEVCKPEYKKDVTNTCFLCDQNSLQCCKVGQGTTSGTCSVCTDLNAADCFTPIKSTVCNTGFVLNSVGVCKATITNCNSYNYAASTCLLCSGSKVQSAATCVTSCTAPKLSYITNSRIICQGCTSDCSTCTYPDTNNRCSTCTSANGYFQTNLGCSTCYSTATCSAYTGCTCTTCPGGYLVSGVCYSSCPSGTYLNGAVCSNCAGCSSCTGTAIANCNSPRTCVTGYYLDPTNTVCCLTGKYNNAGSCSTCVANCNKCTANTVAGCTEVATGFYSTGAAITGCDTNMKKCKNTGTVYESGEECKYGSLSAYSTGAWSGACKIGAPTGNCDINFKDSALATKCGQCSTGFALELTGYTCVATGSCPAGSIELKNFQYKIKGITRQGTVCAPYTTHTTSYGELYFYNVNTCEAGYYLIKTGSSIASFVSTGPYFELILCGKCHESCLTCFDFSAYACKSCATGTVLYMSTCISACPSGYTADVSRVCQVNTCSVLTYTYITTGPMTNCVKKCPLNNFANNDTWTCDSCHSDCDQCWGPANTDCRACADATGKYAYGNGSCVSCDSGKYIDASYNFNCSSFTLYTKMNNMPASALSTHSELTGVTITDIATSTPQTLTVDASSYLIISTNGRQVNLPDITYTEDETCFRHAIEMDLYFGTSSASWHNKNLFLKEDGTEIGTWKTNQWDFETALGTYNTANMVSKWRVFINNTNCTKKALKLSISTDISAPANWGVKNLRSYWYHCPTDCISCFSTYSCERCKEGKFFYTQPNECQVPYTSLYSSPQEIVKTYSFLFKKNSVYLFFSKTMNFTLGDKFPYFFPSFFTGGSRILQNSNTSTLNNSEVRFVGNNFMELYSPGYSASSNTKGYYTFRYPHVDVDKVGYNFTSVDVVYIRNSLPYTFMLTYLEILSANKFLVRVVFTGVIFFIVYAMGANWLMVENLQKLYLLLFFSVSYSADMEAIMDLMDFSFFGWFQILPELVLGPNTYWDFVKYDEYISTYDKSRAITTEFINYIPEGKLGKYLVRKSFVVHMINLILIFILFALLYVIFKPIKMCLVKKYYYKEKLVKTLTAIDNFLHFKFFVRFIMLTFPPFIFYGLANVSNLEFSRTYGMISAAICLGMMGLWGLAWLQYFITAFVVPTPLEARNIVPTWKVRLVLPFTEFMRYYKHPDDPYGMSRASTDDDDNLRVKVKVTNEHMCIKDQVAENKVFTLREKDELKTGGARVFKKEDETELNPKLSKPKKKPGFIPIEKVMEMEQKENEKKKEQREAEKQKDAKKKAKEDENKDKKDKNKEGDKKNDKSGSSSSDSEGSKDSKGEKKKKDDDKSSSSDSSDNSNTEDSEDKDIVGSDVRQVGRLLGKAVLKVQTGPGCCACNCIRKNRKCIKLNYWMEKSARFYSLIRLLHMALMCGLIWYFSSSPFLQIMIFAASQSAFFIWTLLCRPYTYIMLNVSLIFVEFCFTGLAWLMFLLQGSILIGLNSILYLVGTIMCLCIFLVSIFTFIAFAIFALTKWLSTLNSKDPM